MSTTNVTISWRPILIGIIVLVAMHFQASAGALLAQEIEAAVEPRAAWAVAFGGSEATYRFEIVGIKPIPKRANWSLLAESRTIARGEVEIGQKRDQPDEFSVPLKFPSTRPGVRYPVQLQIEVPTADKPIVYQQQIMLFTEAPFHDRQEWLEKNKPCLYDPEGNTAKVFDAAKIPYTFARTAAAIDARASLILIGEGTSLESERGLIEDLIQMAAAGSKVLVLAPSAGQLPVPGSAGSKLATPTQIMLSGPEVLLTIDKTLAGTWAPNSQLPLRMFQLQADRDAVVWNVDAEAPGCSWIELTYQPTKGRMIVCGFGLIDRWDAGPGPRYLFAALLEQLTTDLTIQTPAERE